MKAEVRLTRFGYDPGTKHMLNDRMVVPLTIVAQGTGMPSAIFIYQVFKNVNKPGALGESQPVQDVFRAVARPLDIYELSTIPGTDVMAETFNPFYRRDTVELFCETEAEAEDTYKRIVSDVKSLVDNMNASFYLAANEILTITDQEVVMLEAPNQVMLGISWKPAATSVATDGSDVQTIVDADATKQGWLPVSEVPQSFQHPVPTGARFFYNMAEDKPVADEFPLLTPNDQHLLFIDGLKIPYGTLYKITGDALYWMDFTPGEFGFFTDGNAPWPTDYTSPSDPGTGVPTITLLAFRS